MTVQKKQYSVNEVATLLRVSRIAVHQKIRKGQLKAKKVGRNYVIEEDAFCELIGNRFSEKMRHEIDQGVTRVVKEYEKTLKLLGKE
jgi:excisionase family DNA binding protein